MGGAEAVRGDRLVSARKPRDGTGRDGGVAVCGRVRVRFAGKVIINGIVERERQRGCGIGNDLAGGGAGARS